MKDKIRRGDIFYANLNPVSGSEQGGRRPVLVIQNNTGNRYSTTVIVAAITTKIKPGLPTHLPLSGVSGLQKGSVVLLEQLRSIDKMRLKRRIGSLGCVAMSMVNAALAISLALPHPKTIMTLCPQCSRDFCNSEAYALRRIDENQPFRELCTVCSVGLGFDYEVLRTGGEQQ